MTGRALKTTPFDPAEHLHGEEMVAVFLAEALASGDDAFFQHALQVAARARGMSEVAAASGLGRESLYKALAPGAQPRFSTVRRVMDALGVTITVAPVTSRTKKQAAQRRAGPARPAVANVASRKSARAKAQD